MLSHFFTTDLDLVMSLNFSIMHKCTHIMRKIFKSNIKNGNESPWTNKQIKQISLFCILNGKLKAAGHSKVRPQHVDKGSCLHQVYYRQLLSSKSHHLIESVSKNTGRKFIFREEKTHINIKLKLFFIILNFRPFCPPHILERSAL